MASAGRLFHAVVLGGISLGSGACGPRVDTDDAGDGNSQGEAGPGPLTDGLGTGSSATTEPGTATTPGSSSFTTADPYLDVGVRLDIDTRPPPPLGPYECCWGGGDCDEGLACDAKDEIYMCLPECVDADLDCPPLPDGRPTDCLPDYPPCLRQCELDEECPEGWGCFAFDRNMSLCMQSCVVPIV